MQHTKIGFQDLTNKVTILDYCSDDGELATTGKVLNNLYNTTVLAKQLIKEGTHDEPTYRIDVSSTVNIDNYEWGLIGTDFSEYSVTYENSSSEFLEHHSSTYKFLYLFSEADNKWYVSSNDNPAFNSLADLL